MKPTGTCAVFKTLLVFVPDERSSQHESILKIYIKETHTALLFRNLHFQFDFYLPFFFVCFLLSQAVFFFTFCWGCMSGLNSLKFFERNILSLVLLTEQIIWIEQDIHSSRLFWVSVFSLWLRMKELPCVYIHIGPIF